MTLQEQIKKTRFIVFDFDGVFTDNAVYVSETGQEMVRCWRGDGIGLRTLDRLGIQNMVLSTEVNPVVSKRCEKLKIECIQGCPDKRAELTRIIEERGFVASEVGFMGNDINDREVLQMVGLPIVVADAHHAVADLGLYMTEKLGGYGAVREVCDMFEQVLTVDEA